VLLAQSAKGLACSVLCRHAILLYDNFALLEGERPTTEREAQQAKAQQALCAAQLEHKK